ncbi:MarR family transcriptional regulator [Methanosarcina sp. MSH10X1]|uniref:helix-turn-helix transcriptional regulator n=1 Tax=Methanosarcina sp. MSH10X1 TaxID=2507075 RepID=UPI000FFBAEDE|nr:MarR family transcriptional regulator [Methanosarcina sp. MSH10X1]RXA19957.1 MarR family transcriptional regulator [Methanosarcina sp. MSH10X1]
MNLRFCILCTAALLALGVFALPASGIPFLADGNVTATIHGATYAWDTLESLNDTVIDINSNPPQSIVAKNGTYSFELGPGDYIITARYYRNRTILYSKQTTLKIEDEGNYVFDLLLYPVSENQAIEKIGDKTDYASDENPAEKPRTGSSTISYLPVALIFLFLLGGGYKLSRKRSEIKRSRSQAEKSDTTGIMAKILHRSPGSGVKPESRNIREATSAAGSVTEPVTETADNSEIEIAALKKLPLSADLCEVLDIIRGHKGRISQKHLRSRLVYSEVKVSLLLSELEKRGLIKKLKHGRENIVVLTNEGYTGNGKGTRNDKN